MKLKRRDLVLALLPALITLWAVGIFHRNTVAAVFITIIWIHLIHILKYNKTNES